MQCLALAQFPFSIVLILITIAQNYAIPTHAADFSLVKETQGVTQPTEVKDDLSMEFESASSSEPSR